MNSLVRTVCLSKVSMCMSSSKNVKQTPDLQFLRVQTVIAFLFPRPLWKQISALYFGWMEGEIGLPRSEVKIRILLKHCHILKNSERWFIEHQWIV